MSARAFTVAGLGDIHLDETPGGDFDECVRLLNWVADDFDRTRPDLVCITGDVFERKSTAKERNAFARWLIRVANERPIYMVAGNHDTTGDLAIFAKLETVWPIFVEETSGVERGTPEALVMGLAWPRRASLLAALGKDASSAAGDELAQTALRSVLGDMGTKAEAFGADHPRILVSHANVRDAKIGEGQPSVNQGMLVGVDDLALARADLVLLGHIHLPQGFEIVRDDGVHVPVLYCGSTRRTKHGEVEEKGYVLAKFEGRTLVSTERVALPCPPMILLDAVYDPATDRLVVADTEGEPRLYAHEAKDAEVRLRYTCDADRQVAAKARAEEWKAAALAWARTVDLDPVVRPVLRAKVPEIADARTTRAKLETLHTYRGIALGARAPSFWQKLEAIEGDAALAARHAAPGLIHRAAMGGVVPFPNRVEVDFDQIPGSVIAITGDNGAGKSLFVEAIVAAITPKRKCASRGTLLSIATERDAFVEADVENGSFWSIRQTMDAIARTGESVVCDRDGTPQLKTTSVVKFDAWAEQHLASARILNASTITPSNAVGFLDLDDAPRKDLILALLGIERLVALAKAARERAAAYIRDLEIARARLADLGDVDVETARAALVEARANVDTADAMVSDATRQIAEARAKLDMWSEMHRKIGERARELEAADQRLGKSVRAVEGLEARRKALVVAPEEKLRIQEASAELERLTLDERRLADLVTTAQSAAAESVRAAKAADEALTAVHKDGALARARDDRAKAALVDADKIEAASSALAAWVAKEKAALDGLAAIEAEIAELRGSMTGVLDTRITGLRSGLETIAAGRDTTEHLNAIATSALSADVLLRDRAVAAPATLRERETRLTALRREHHDAMGQRIACEALARRADDVPRIRKEAEDAKTDVERLRALYETKRAEKKTAEDAASLSRQAAADAIAARNGAAAAIAPLKDIAARAAIVAESDARLAELLPQLEAALDEFRQADDAFKAIVALPRLENGPRPDVATYEAYGKRAHEAQAAAVADAARKEMMLAETEKKSARAAKLALEIRTFEEEIADWTLLADGLGRDGVQALEIDAAGPTITAIANDLLHSCHGTRFSVRVDAARLSADGKDMLEGCDVTVLDTLRGREGPGETFSDGEKALLNETLSLAFAKIACKSAGGRGATLIRDETDRALTEENAVAYVKMLRRAIADSPDSKVLLISHNPEAVALADARIEIGGGRIEVRA